MSDIFWLTNVQMARLEPYFPKSHGKPRVDDRRVLSGIIFVNRNGLRWRDAPKEYGPHKAPYNRWKRWSDKGIFAQMMVGLAAEDGEEKTVMIPLETSLSRCPYGQRMRPISRHTARRPAWASKKGA
jgi:transposase